MTWLVVGFLGGIGLLFGVWTLLALIDVLDWWTSRITSRERRRAQKRRSLHQSSN